MFRRNSSSTGKVGRAAKPGETPNRKGIPVTNPDPNKTRVVGSKPKKG